MFGTLVIRLSEDNRMHFYGALDGSVHVTDTALYPFLTYDAALKIDESSQNVKGVSAILEREVFLTDADHVGKGEKSFFRRRFDSEIWYYKSKIFVDYHEGFTLCGVSAMDILEEVYGEELTMLEGSMVTVADNEAHLNKIVISKTLAEKNGLSLGDTLTLDMLSLYYDEEQSSDTYLRMQESPYVYTYVIGGIYENKTDNTDAVSIPHLLNANKIYVPIATLADIGDSEEMRHLYEDSEADYLDRLTDDPRIVPDALYLHLDDMAKASELEKRLNEVGFYKTVKLTPYMSDAASSPSARLSEIVSRLLVGVTVLGFAVLLLSSFFHMKARHRELAVLTALGKKRGAVALSFFAETAVLTAAAFVLSGLLTAYAVSLCAVPISEYLYSAELTANITGETADMFILEDMTVQAVTAKLESFDFLQTQYILPSIRASLPAAAVLLLLVYALVFVYVQRLNVLSGIGGKE